MSNDVSDDVFYDVSDEVSVDVFGGDHTIMKRSTATHTYLTTTSRPADSDHQAISKKRGKFLFLSKLI